LNPLPPTRGRSDLTDWRGFGVERSRSCSRFPSAPFVDVRLPGLVHALRRPQPDRHHLDIYSHVTPPCTPWRLVPWVGGQPARQQGGQGRLPLQPCSLCWMFGGRAAWPFTSGSCTPLRSSRCGDWPGAVPLTRLGPVPRSSRRHRTLLANEGLAGCLDGAEQAVGFVVDAGGEQQGGRITGDAVAEAQRPQALDLDRAAVHS
jgi:hypothetical protein